MARRRRATPAEAEEEVGVEAAAAAVGAEAAEEVDGAAEDGGEEEDIVVGLLEDSGAKGPDEYAATLARCDEEGRQAAPSITEAEPPEEVLRLMHTEYREKLKESRKSNGTGAAYGQWQREWQQWCEASAGEDVNGWTMQEWKRPWSLLVTPGKVAMWLRSYVALRPSRPGGTIAAGTHNKMASVEQAAKAMGSLYEDQKASRDDRIQKALVNVPRPRGGSDKRVTAAIREIQQRMSKTMVEDYVDRGCRRFLAEGYTFRQHVLLCQIYVFFKSWKPERNAMIRGTQMHLAHVLRHTFAIRADDIRRACLADLFCVRAHPSEGPMASTGQCYWLCLGKYESKMNSEGRHQLAVGLRHMTHVELCPWFALGHSFVVFYEILGLEPPDYRPTFREDGAVTRPWYDFKLLPGFDAAGRGKQGELNPKIALAYDAQNRQVKHMYANIDDPVSIRMKTVHLARGQSLRDAAANGATLAELTRHAGHRAGNALQHSYLTDPAYNPARTTAGFPGEPGHFYLLRLLKRPSQALKDRLFVKLRNNLDTVLDGTYEHRRYVCNATRQWAELLDQLAEAFLQDVAAIWEDVKDTDWVGRLDLLHTAEFADFKTELHDAMANAPFEEMRANARRYEERGDKHTAAVMREVIRCAFPRFHSPDSPDAPGSAGSDALPVMRMPRRQERELGCIYQHFFPTSDPARDQLPAPPCASSRPPTAASPAAAPSTLPRGSPGRVDAGVSMAETPRPRAPPALDLADASTWPPGRTPNLPDFVRRIQLHRGHKTVQELADVYFVGPPALRDVERVYGTTGGSNGKCNWLAASNQGGSRKVNTEFVKCNYVWSWIENQHDRPTAIAALQQRIYDHFGADVGHSWSQLHWLREQLCREKDGAEERSAVAVKRAQKRLASQAAKRAKTP